MKLYIAVIAVSATVIGLAVGYRVDALLMGVALAWGCAVALIGLDGLEAWLLRRLPERWFAAGSPAFRTLPVEMRLYRRLGVKQWHRFVPELGSFTHFSKSTLAQPADNAYLERFLLESDYGMVIHACNGVTGFLPALLFPGTWLAVPLLCGAVNLVLSALPLAILRYNSPRLERLMECNTRYAAKKRKR